MTPKFKIGKEPLVVTKEGEEGQITLDYGKLKRAALTLRALNHPLRKLMLGMMEQRKRIAVSEIYKKIKIEQSVASQHLAIMRRAGVVKTTRDGKFIYYSVNSERIAEITDMVERLAQNA